MMMQKHVVGIDVGGTKTSVCVAAPDGTLCAQQRMVSGGDVSLAGYEKRLDALLQAVLAKSGVGLSGIAAVGISAPGPLNVRDGLLLAPPNNPGWIDVPIVEMLRRMIDRPVFMNNDANAGVLAEQMFGAYHDVKNMIYLTFSTGMGGGLIAAGELVQGVTDMGGEVGHQMLDVNGPPCPCGMRGCFEVFCGGRNVELRLRKQLADDPAIETDLRQRCNHDLETLNHAMFAAAARDGDPFAVAQWDAFIERLAQGIGNLIMILNPEVILLGTIAVHEGDLVLKPLREKMSRYAWSWPLQACRIEATSLGKRLGDLAAVAVALHGMNAPIPSP